MSCDFVAGKPVISAFAFCCYTKLLQEYFNLVLSFPVETLHGLGFCLHVFCVAVADVRTQMILNSLWAGLILPFKWVRYPPLTTSIGGILLFTSLLPATQQHFAVRCYCECKKDSWFTGPSSWGPARLYLTLPTPASWRSTSYDFTSKLYFACAGDCTAISCVIGYFLLKNEWNCITSGSHKNCFAF